MCQSFIGNIFSLAPDRSWGHEAAAVLPLSGCQTQFDIFLTIIYIYIKKNQPQQIPADFEGKITQEKLTAIDRNKNVGTQLTSNKLHGQLYA